MSDRLLNSIEIHYFIEQNLHEMEAFAQNRCEYQILQIIQSVSKQLKVDLDVYTLPFEEGGLREWLKIVKKNEDKDAPITTEVLKWLVIGILGSPLFFYEKCTQEVEKDNRLSPVQKEEYCKFLKSKDDLTPIENKCSKLRSNFYETLEKTPKVNMVSFNSHNEESIYTKEVSRNAFANFILTDNTLEPIEIEDALIQITAPVIAKGKYNTWHGLYNDEYINFKMLSNEFKKLVQTGEVTFRNGFSIKCTLRIHKSLNDNGEERITKYEVLQVDSYFVAEDYTETHEGKKKRIKKEIDNAPNLFSEIDFDE